MRGSYCLLHRAAAGEGITGMLHLFWGTVLPARCKESKKNEKRLEKCVPEGKSEETGFVRLEKRRVRGGTLNILSHRQRGPNLQQGRVRLAIRGKQRDNYKISEIGSAVSCLGRLWRRG